MDNQFTEKEKNAKHILEEDFIPTLELELKSGKNYRLVSSYYSFNYCRQASITSVPLLETLLPEYTWEVWEAIWECNLKTVNSIRNLARFDHAWVYGYTMNKERQLIVDLTLDELDDSIGKEEMLHSNFQSFRLVRANDFPMDMPDYENIKIREKRKMNIEISLNENEFYTNLKGFQLVKKVCRRMKNKRMFDSIVYKK